MTPTSRARKLAPGTWRRIVQFAAPYRRQLLGFLVVIVIDAVVGVTQPLIFKQIIDQGIGTNPPQTGRPGLVAALAGLVAGLALFSAVLSLVNRFYSARIGEGLIYDMRSKVYAHVQRMPIAFFTRTQTGALITRLNNDVLGAQQAFTGTLSNVVSNAIGVVLTLVAMFYLSWQITLLSLVLLPLFVIPARLVGARLQELTRESYGLNAEMNTTMTERFNVAGALLVKLFGRPGAPRTRRSATRPAGSATSASPRRCTGGSSSSRSPPSRRWRRRSSTASAAPWPPTAPWRSAPSSRCRPTSPGSTAR